MLPADLLVGAYYPWRENKWGYEVAVPYKNPLLSDAYSQLYPWKKVMADSYKEGEWPLWNPYSYSGYPLAANLQSAVFYPFNVLFLLLPLSVAWNCYLILGSLLSSFTMYALMRAFKFDKGVSLLSGLAYGYSAYALSWMEFGTATNSMVWIPLLILFVEKAFEDKEMRILWYLAPVIFMLISSGNFQMSIYGLIILASYFVFKLISYKKFFRVEAWLRVFGAGLLGLLMSSLILGSGFEMLRLSLRNVEESLVLINYGLVPLSQLITTLAPDFFGNPATGNYWGVLNYHETLIYGGVLVFWSIAWCSLNFSKLSSRAKYFLMMVLVSLVFYVDNPLVSFLYGLDISGLKTMTAGRNAFFWIFSGSVLLGPAFKEWVKSSFWKRIRLFVYMGTFFLVVGGIVFLTRSFLVSLESALLERSILNMMVAMRNMVIPAMLLSALVVVLILLPRWKYVWVLLLMLILADSGRFAKKYLPASESKYVFPKTEVTDFLIEDKSVFRVEKEKGALLSPNTWTMYGLESPSGYDPMALADYTKKYNEDLNGFKDDYSRYAELDKYDASALGKYNVKYLLALKKDDEDKVPGENINYKIDMRDWEKVFESETVAVLKNLKYEERVSLINENGESVGEVDIIDRTNNSLRIGYSKAENGSSVVIRDTWYPGWKAVVNGKEKVVEKFDGIFRKIKVDQGDGVLEMRFEPRVFRDSLRISVAAFVVWFLVVVVDRNKGKRSVKKIR